MPNLAYRARDEEGRLRRGFCDAAGEPELRDLLRSQGLTLVRASQRDARPPRTRISRQERILFTYHLQAVMASGIPLLVGLDDLAAQARTRAFRRVIEDIGDSLRRGSTLAQALERHPTVFPRDYTRMVDAGEAGGRLDSALERLVRLLEWQEEMRSHVRQLVTYPVVVLCALAGLIVLLLTFVLPRFRGVLETLRVELPAPTRAVMALSNAMVQGWMFVVAGAVVLVAGFVLARRNPELRERTDGLLLRLPLAGPLTRALASSQIAHFLGAFTEAGVPIGTGLEITSRLVVNRRIARRLEEVRERLLEGETLARAFQRAAVLSPLTYRLLAIGEETGRLPESLAKAEAFYDREIPRRVRGMFEVLGPALTIVMGVVLVLVLIAVLLPIYRLYGAVHGGR